MQETTGLVSLHGTPLTLIGNEASAGLPAGDFEVIDNNLQKVKLSSCKGKVCIICSVPSLDTSVCDLEARKFNEKASSLGEGVEVWVISMDLPFAQKRWCGAAGVKNIRTLSDHREAEFGKMFGVLIKELRLLARAVFVVDKTGVIRYKQIVQEMEKEPDYEAALAAAKDLLQ